METIDNSSLFLAGFSLFIFGILYNWLVGMLNKAGISEGYTSLLVAAGTAVTLAAVLFFFGLDVFLVIVFFFVCSGTPMVLGDVWRYSQARKREQEARPLMPKHLPGAEE